MPKSDAKLREELAAAGHTPKPKPARNTATVASKTGTDDAADKTPRVRIPAGSKPSQVLALHIPNQDDLYATARLTREDEASKSTLKTLGDRIDTLAKKVGEKAVNLLRNRANPDGVQVYTRIAMDHLIDQGQMTSKSLRDVYAAKYKPGTCAAQSNQIMQLFPALGIATREDKSTLKLAKGSLIVSEYRKAKK